jgi:hypothetical protein
MLRAIAAAKKKNDGIDASEICDGPRSGELLSSCKEAGGLPAYPAAQKTEFVFFLPGSSDRTSALSILSRRTTVSRGPWDLGPFFTSSVRVLIVSVGPIGGRQGTARATD